MPSSPPPGIRSRTKKPVRLRSWQPPSGRDWVALPIDLILYVFHMLDPVELLLGGAKGVCRSWRRAARDEPVLWLHIDMRGYVYRCDRSHVPFLALVQAAVHRSKGQCEAFWADYGDDDVLLFLGEQTRSLKSIRFMFCYKFTKEVFVTTINMFPLLEELEISECSLYDNDVIGAVAKSCPWLKHFRYIKSYIYGLHSSDGEALAITGMRGLHSLELHGNLLTHQGLMAILDNCTHLELLMVLNCPNVTMDSLLDKCASVRIVAMRGDDYPYYKVSRNPFIERQCSVCDFSEMLDMAYDYYFGYLVDGFFPEDLIDYEDSSRYIKGVYVTNLDDDEDSRMLCKSMRRYLKINTEV